MRKENTLQTDRGETGVKESFAVRYSAAAAIDFVLLRLALKFMSSSWGNLLYPLRSRRSLSRIAVR